VKKSLDDLATYGFAHTYPHTLRCRTLKEKMMDNFFLITELAFCVAGPISSNHISFVAIVLCQIIYNTP
jgi:hypothetical protein